MKTSDEIIDAKLELWWRNTPKYERHRIGCFGIPTSPELLKQAEERLRANGCTLAVGPMEGNTWRSHRAIIESDGSPPFLLEPTTPLGTPELLTQAGYEILAQYSSSKFALSQESPDLTRLEKRLGGIEIRPLDLSKLEDELRRIYQLSTKAFTENFLYTPISEAEFLTQYTAFKSHLTSNCAFLAEDQGQTVGFVFGYPDPQGFVAKTLAVLPQRKYAGLGTLLVDCIQKAAFQDGFRTAIHALQREDNQSLRISHRFQATVFRRYALFAKEL